MYHNLAYSTVFSKKQLYFCIFQAFAGLIDSGRLETKNTDVEPYVVDGTTHLSELNHGIRTWYYWGPSYGEQAEPDLAKFTKVKKLATRS